MSGPAEFVKRPVGVEAWQVFYENREDVAKWCGGVPCGEVTLPSGEPYTGGVLYVQTLEGQMWANAGDWVIRGVAGEFYPCKPDIFEATYSKVW